ncbi:hypothetical protein DPMN_113639 [Dreissena polymorpha]|uniref:Uncharacterized protein n=1 Tax=Dreissena polymorpha TaxID=45954 RepID=A0A9D4QR05_DREPO|nr:hypothetical protein DPMN_113639 [Dreissena polymorpha]
MKQNVHSYHFEVREKPKNAPTTGCHVFQATGTTLELVQNLLTKFHDDRTINMASIVLTMKNATPLGGHVFPPTGTIFKPIQDIVGTNHLTKFHDDRTINVKCPAPWMSYIIRTNLLTKFHEYRKINVASRVLTRKNAPPPGSHVCQPTSIIFELVQDIIGVNHLTKIHEDRKINVASRVLKRKNAPPLGSHVFQANKNCPAPGGHVFSPIWTIFELFRDIKETNLLTKFHDDGKNIVTSRVFTRNTSPPPGGHACHRNGTIFKLNQHIIYTNILTNFKLSRGINKINVLTKFHEDQTINVASGVFTWQNVDDARRKTHNGRRTTDKKRSQKLTMSTLCSVEFAMIMNIMHVTNFHEDRKINVTSRVLT